MGEIEDVQGFAPCLTERELKLLDGFEGFPKMYRREAVLMQVVKEGKVAGTEEALAYIKNDTKVFNYPCAAYLKANELTREAFHKLSGVRREDQGWVVRRARDLERAGFWKRQL